MRWKTLFCFVLVTALVMADANKQGSKRRKVRRKVKQVQVPQQEEVVLVVNEPEEIVVLEEVGDEDEEEIPVGLEPVATEERNARGFLDQYYQQFDRRVQPSLERSDIPDDDIEEDDESQYEYDTTAVRGKSFDSLSVAPAPSNTVYTKVSSLPSVSSSSPYIKPVPLPSLYSSYSSGVKPKELVSFPSSSSSSSLGQDPRYSTSFGSGSTLSSMPERTFHTSSSSGYDNFIDDSGTGYKTSGYDTKQVASKYFGVATTTSQDIQLGLTFTVPFLSIPLSGLTNIFSGAGDGLSSFGNLFDNFDTSNLLIIGVVAVGAIFILPQVLYWLTGVNLSAFNWGRSDDPNFLNNLANTVDAALSDYDINVKQCMSNVMCNEIKKRGSKLEKAQGKEGSVSEDSSMTDMIGYGIISTAAKSQTVKTFLGDARVEEVMGVAKSGYTCERAFAADSCPWHPSTSKKIVAKLILNSDLDLATLANVAMQGAKAFA